ncbi:SIR2 family protein [Vibrio anguillarum]|uniref:SIR2 family protein n=1 Tax=Vibrio anguillarum TaxID=55601 RepID=UPI0008420D20|nr:SIR2 family protein [Vibrio anguillarum]
MTQTITASSISEAVPPAPYLQKGEVAIRYPSFDVWHSLNEATLKRIKGVTEFNQDHQSELSNNQGRLKSTLYKSLQLPNLAFFAGSGTSLKEPNGPSMWGLWVACTFNDGHDDGITDNITQMTKEAKEICDLVRYNELKNPNIEHFLSCCDAYQVVYQDETVAAFIRKVKTQVLKLCSDFLDSGESDISAYRDLLRKLAKRRTRDPRLKVFTTNYDMCFENASADLGMMVVDGFSYTRKRRFDGQYFNFDVVRRDNEGQSFIQGVIQLFKLHGSVSWERKGTEIFESLRPDPDNACLIYPAKGKYQQAFIQPHLELLSRFLEFLREPNSCLLMSGFGFNDDHLSEPILSAVKSNPSFKLIVTDFGACSQIANQNKYWKRLSDEALNGADVTFINASFKDIASFIPNLAALSPSEQLAKSLQVMSIGDMNNE